MPALSERQTEIIRHTIELIGEEGVHNFSIRKLAKRVGVTEPAVYRHFESKDDLMVNVASYIVQNWNSLILEIRIPRLPAIDQIRIIFESAIQYFDENRLFTRTVFSVDLFSSDSGMASILRRLKQDGILRFSELLQEAQSQGEVSHEHDCRSVAKIFFGSVQWVVSDWIAEGFTDDLPERWAEVWSELERLLR